ncbi:MAG: GNAT family N-acetyltransferase [Rubrivivax sp.]|nr:GNAT family N-acetyltransferase [Rubrivivax sp.]
MPDHATPNAALEIIRLRPADVPECIDIARRSFDYFDGDAEAVQNWFDARILNNPWQHALDGIGLGARDGGKLVAFRAMFAQPWWLEGQSTVIAFAAHTCIEPAYRGGGLGGRMIAVSRDFADLTGSTSAGHITQQIYRKLGYDAIGGEGNDFFRLRASYVGSMQSRLGAGLGRAAGMAIDAFSHSVERRLGGADGFKLESPTICSEEFDDFWSTVRDGYPSCLERSRRYLNWRLFEFPTHPLTLWALRDESGRLRGCGVWHELRYSRHVACAVLRDLFVAHGDEQSRRAFVALALRHWRELGISWVSLELASPALTRLFAAMGSEPVASRGNRYHVHAKQGLGHEVAEGWLRSGLDGDYFDTRPIDRRLP